MECTINWLAASGMGFVAETGSGHLLTMDGAPDGGGRNLAPRPMETVLAGTGACAAYDVVLILQRGRHDVRDCKVKVTSERAADRPEGVHAHPHAFRGQWPRPDRGGRCTSNLAVARQVLLGQRHARQDRRDHAQPRSRRLAVRGYGSRAGATQSTIIPLSTHVPLLAAASVLALPGCASAHDMRVGHRSRRCLRKPPVPDPLQTERPPHGPVMALRSAVARRSGTTGD